MSTAWDAAVRGETYSSVSGLEAVQLLCGALELLSGDDGLEDILGDVPELLVLLLEENDGAGALAVEAGGAVEDSLADDLLDLLVRDGGLGLEAVVGAAGLDGGEEFSGTHFGGGLREGSGCGVREKAGCWCLVVEDVRSVAGKGVLEGEG